MIAEVLLKEIGLVAVMEEYNEPEVLKANPFPKVISETLAVELV